MNFYCEPPVANYTNFRMDALTLTVPKEATEVIKKESERFLAAVLGEPAKALGGLALDKINVRRHRNLVAITAEANRYLRDAGITAKQVPLNIIHPALEAASLEEDDDLQTIWAKLIANAADPRNISPVLPCFPTTLKDLTSRDVKFLDALYRNASRLMRRGGYPHVRDIQYTEDNLLKIYAEARLSRRPCLASISVEDYRNYREEIDADMNDFNLTLATAMRHQLLKESHTPAPLKLSEYLNKLRRNDYNRAPDDPQVKMIQTVSFTDLGSSFLTACQSPE